MIRPRALAAGCLSFLVALSAHALDLTASHVNPPGEPTFEAFERFGRSLATSGENLGLRHYPRGQLGNEQDIIEQVRLGALGMASVSTAALSAFAPSAGVFDIPFLFRDADRHPWLVADSDIGRAIARRIGEESGLEVVAWWSAGMRHVFTRSKPIERPEDMRGVKIRVIGSPVYMDTFNALGAKAVPMPYGEVYTALATGTIDAAENDTTGYRNMKFDEQAPHLALTGHFFLMKAIIVNRGVLARLSVAQRAAFDAALADATRYQRALSTSKFEADMQAFAGGTRTRVTHPDRAAFEAAVTDVQTRYARRYGEALVRAIRAMR